MSNNHNEDPEHSKLDALDQKIRDVSDMAGIESPEAKAARMAKQQKIYKQTHSSGAEFAATILGCFFLGIWLDKKFDAAPLFMIVLLVLGTIVSFYNLYRMSENLPKSQVRDDSRLHSDEKNGKKSANK